MNKLSDKIIKNLSDCKDVDFYELVENLLPEVEKLENDNNELLECLIDQSKQLIDIGYIPNLSGNPFHPINIIERQTGKKWEDIVNE